MPRQWFLSLYLPRAAVLTAFPGPSWAAFAAPGASQEKYLPLLPGFSLSHTLCVKEGAHECSDPLKKGRGSVALKEEKDPYKKPWWQSFRNAEKLNCCSEKSQFTLSADARDVSPGCISGVMEHWRVTSVEMVSCSPSFHTRGRNSHSKLPGRACAFHQGFISWFHFMCGPAQMPGLGHSTVLGSLPKPVSVRDAGGVRREACESWHIVEDNKWPLGKTQMQKNEKKKNLTVAILRMETIRWLQRLK